MGQPWLTLDIAASPPAAPTPFDRVGVRWLPHGWYQLSADDGIALLADQRMLLTGEHVQACLEDAGCRLEARSLDALFDLDEVVRLSSPPVFLVPGPRPHPIGIVRESGAVIARVPGGPGSLQTDRSRAVAVLRAVAPIGARSLLDWRLTRPGVDEVRVFEGLLAGLHGRSGVGVRELQDWVTARTSSCEVSLAAAGAALAAGPELSPASYREAVAGLGGQDVRRAADRVARATSRSRVQQDPGAVAL